MWKKFNMHLQGFGRTLLLPIGVIAPIGLVLGISNALSQSYMIDLIPILGNPVINGFLVSIKNISQVIFNNMPLLFAMGVAYGLSRKEKGIAVFAAVISYLILNMTMNQYLVLTDSLKDTEVMEQFSQTMVLGIQTVRVDVLGGMLMGGIAAWATDNFYDKELPTALAFFSGKKLPPMITIAIAVLLGFVLPSIWGFVTSILTNLGFIFSKQIFGTFTFWTVNRLLIPFGLHHVFDSLIRYTEMGGVYDICGQTYIGVLNSLNAGLFDPNCASQVSPREIASLTRFMAQGQMVNTLFLIPTTGLAMYHEVKPKNKKYAVGIIMTSVLAAFLGNVTEPMEFTFMFISPFLYVFHALIIGVGGVLLALLGTAVGYIRGTVFDFFIFGVMVHGSRWYNILLVGIPLGIVNYFVFRFAIRKWNLITPGREASERIDLKDVDRSMLAQNIIEALGGRENINYVNNCVTRLRVDINNKTLISKDKLDKTGAAGIFFPTSKHVQIVYGPQVEFIKNEIDKEMRT